MVYRLRGPVLAGLLVVLGALQGAGVPPLPGFSPESALAERNREARFRAAIDPANLRASMQRLTARPHHLGSAYGKDSAEWILAQFREWGFDASIETFDVLFPTPTERVLELLEPTRYTARLREPPVGGDPASALEADQLAVYNAYSPDGDVRAPLIYANYGLEEDYAALASMGISVRGAIVLVRYGRAFRGIKPKIAAEHGAVGCIIYSDPTDDGYSAGDTFPKGPQRPRDGAQRGSVLDVTVYPGDPLTPGIAATRDAARIPRSQALTIPRIPVLPISYGDAQPLLEAMEGPVAPAAWRGGLPITYHLGPGRTQVHLKVSFQWDQKPLYDVIARMPGSTAPDEWVIRGNHHDAWVYGADDPVSGLAAMLEEARALGDLARQGWRPRRTIVYCAWDGEEAGLIGSTEWVEAHAAELTRKAVAYVNTDNTARGFLRMDGSHSLENLINSVAREVEDPETKLTVWKRLQAYRIANPAMGASSSERQEPRTRPDLRMAALGSGSDYSPFLDHLGIPSVDLRFAGESDNAGIYHSAYDNFYWYTHFSDRDFTYGRALAQIAGTAVLRLADAELLPFEFADLSDTVRHYASEVERLARTRHDQIIERNRQIDEGVLAAVADPHLDPLPVVKEAVPPTLEFAPLENAVKALERAAQRYAQAVARANADGGAALAGASLAEVNKALIAVERAFMLEDGLPNRPWFRHQLYAPGFYTGYGSKTLPGVRESIEQGQWQQVDSQIVRVAAALVNASEAIETATAALGRAR